MSESPFKLGLLFFQLDLNISLLFDTGKCFMLTLYINYQSPEIDCFAKICFLSIKEGNQKPRFRDYTVDFSVHRRPCVCTSFSTTSYKNGLIQDCYGVFSVFYLTKFMTPSFPFPPFIPRKNLASFILSIYIYNIYIYGQFPVADYLAVTAASFSPKLPNVSVPLRL